MLNTLDAEENREKESIDFYKKALKYFIIENQESLQLKDLEMEHYIAVFSLYLYNNNAYKYNLPYLNYQHKKFRQFIITASEKCKLLRKIIAEIRNSVLVKNFIQEYPQKVSNFKIILNDFLASDLNGEITLHEPMSFLGAERSALKDVITILYDGRVWSCKIAEILSKVGSNSYASIVKNVESLLEIKKEVEV